MTDTQSATANNADLAADKVLGKLDERIAAGVEKALDARETKLVDRIAKVFAEAKAKPAEDDAAPSTPRRRMQLAALTADSPEVKEFSIGRLIRGMLKRNPAAICPLELEMCIAAAEDADPRTIQDYVVRTGAQPVTKDMATNPDPAGGYIVPAQVMLSQIIPLLQAQNTILDKVGGAGVSKFMDLSGAPVVFPKVTGGTTAYHVNHDTTTASTAPTKSDMTLGDLELYPHTTAARVLLSNDLVNRSGGAAEGIVRKQIARDIGLMVDYDGYQGNGTSGAPTGIVGTSGINSVSFSGVVLTAAGAYDLLLKMIFEVRKDNALTGNLGWALSPEALLAIQQIKDATDQPKARRIMSDGPDQLLLGYPYVVTTQFPTNQIVFGDWSQFYYGQWGTMFLAVDPLTVLGLFKTQVLAAMQYDFGCAQPTAFCQTSSLTGAP
jgi:HK97 family phage major capsid protein